MYEWYRQFSTNLKSKFNNCLKKRVFYPGQKLIEKGQTKKILYLIIDTGVCEFHCSSIKNRMNELEMTDDPTKVR